MDDIPYREQKQRLLEELLHAEAVGDEGLVNHWATVVNQRHIWTPADRDRIRAEDVDARWRGNILRWLRRNADWLLEATEERTHLPADAWIQTKPIYQAFLHLEIDGMGGEKHAA